MSVHSDALDTAAVEYDKQVAKVSGLEDQVANLQQELADCQGGSGPAPGPQPPDGYRTFYSIDWKNAGTTLPAPWEVRTGKTNNAAQFRAQNVQVQPGVGLVHIAERANRDAQVYSGACNGRIGIPTDRFILEFVCRCEGFGVGIWPSFWGRPQSGGDMQGEWDFTEGFGGHVPGAPNPSGSRVWGSTLIATNASGSYANDTERADWRLPENRWEQTNTIRCQMSSEGLRTWVNGEPPYDPLVQLSNINSSVRSQFTQTGKKMYLRTDFQIGDDPDGTPEGEAGPLPDSAVGQFAKWIIERIDVWVPENSTVLLYDPLDERIGSGGFGFRDRN